MSSPKTPPPPDPVATASAQTASNVATSTANQTMNMVDQYTPDGSLKYDQVGSITIPNGLGGTVTVPRYSATQTLSANGQKLYDTNAQTSQNLAEIGRDQSAKIGGILGTNVDLSNDAIENRLWDLGSKRLTPQFAKDEDALRTRLANSGVQAGSAAWNSEFERLTQAQNDAKNQLLLSGRGQAVQEMLTERNQPLNEISALLNGAQVSQPNFTNTPQTQMAGTDYAGIVNSNYQAQLQAAQMKSQSQNALLGGLFGLAGNLGGMAIYKSDRRLKRDIKRIGTLENGLPFYSFRYRDSDAFHVGLMSDDVKKVRPDAVIVMEDGFDAVDYAKAVQ